MKLVRYLHPGDHYPSRLRKGKKYFAEELYFRDIKFPVKIRDIHKIEKKSYIATSAFGYEKISNLCIKKCFEKNILIYYC